MANNIRLLIIEDEQNIRENLKELLETKGYQIRTSDNGKQGILDAIDFKPHLIICDVMMPKMDGFKVLEYIRKTAMIQNTPFIFLTAKVDKCDIRHGMELGADDYLTKPFTYKELIKVIETRIERQQRIIGEFAKVKHELDTTVFASYYHEFNTPLHGILGGLNLLLNARNTFSENQMNDLIRSILKSGLRLNHSLANLMLYEEIKRSEIYPELQAMFMNGITSSQWVRKVNAELMNMAREMYNRADDVEVDLAVAGIRSHAEYLQRILLELADNALKFSKQGTKVWIKGTISADEYTIEVKDGGKGFELNTLEEINPFKQFNRNRFEQQGLGIGLYLVKRLVSFAQAKMQIISVPDKGTKVALTFQLAQEKQNITEMNDLQQAV